MGKNRSPESRFLEEIFRLRIRIRKGRAEGMDMQEPNIKRNFAYSTLFQILTLITPLITAPYVSRVLGADGLGIHSFTSANQAYFSLFAALGTSSYGARAIARLRKDKREYSRSFWEIEFMT